MPLDEHTIIDRQSEPASARRAAAVAALLTLVIGIGAAFHYASRDLTLSHYDARAHLVVARRVADSLTPGWRQFGAVWLPLPHVLNAVPAQHDWLYRTGASGVAISVGAMAFGVGALTAFLFRRSQSYLAAIAPPLALIANPNVLYLQSTPMTEPLLIGLALASLDAVDRWIARPGGRQRRWAGALLAALVMTRYEGWLVAGALVAIAGWSRPREIARLAAFPAAAIAAFLLLSRASTGVWFVSSGFFVPDNPSAYQPMAVLEDIEEATIELAMQPVVWCGVAGAAVCAALALVRARAWLLPIALTAAAALPFAAFYSGHPHRVRYMIPLVAALTALSGALVAALPRRTRGPAGVLFLAAAVSSQSPLRHDAPMVLEAQWETPWRLEREKITETLQRLHDGTPILASMGSLGHYMQEASHAGFPLSVFLHEGNGDLWADALRWPRRHVRWILIEERAEGGDALAALSRADAAFLNGFEQVAEAGGLALYRRR